MFFLKIKKSCVLDNQIKNEFNLDGREQLSFDDPQRAQTEDGHDHQAHVPGRHRVSSLPRMLSEIVNYVNKNSFLRTKKKYNQYSQRRRRSTKEKEFKK